MIKIIRRPGKSDCNRESVKMFLPNDNNPAEVVSFVQRSLATLGIQIDVPTPNGENGEGNKPIGFAIGGGINESEEEETD